LDSRDESDYIVRELGAQEIGEAASVADEREKKFAVKLVQSECDGPGAAQRAQKKNQNF
jgi:hypothetical protein